MRPVEDAFPGSENVLPAPLSDADWSAWAQSPWLSLLIVLCVITGIVLMKNFLNVLPEVVLSMGRVRGSQDIEGSLRLSRDRNLAASLLVIPFTMLLSRFRIYDPWWMADFTPEMHLLWTFLCFLGYLLLRWILAGWLRSPHIDSDIYTMARRFAWSAFILLTILLLALTGILRLCGASDEAVHWLLIDVTAVVFFVFCIRKSQIFNLSCAPFTTFLYLCALEFLPLAIWIASATVEI